MGLVAIAQDQGQETGSECARLIPGELPCGVNPGKKKPQSVRLHASSAAGGISRRPGRGLLALLELRPLQSRRAWRFIRSLTMDWALIALNWLIVGAVLVTLREFFPFVWSFGYAAGSPVSLLGLAVLHAALITLLGYTEGLYGSKSNSRSKAEILGKSVVWATVLLCAAYSLQRHPWTISALICCAGTLHFAAMWAWRSRLSEEPEGLAPDRRNVLIIGSGKAGRLVAAEITQQAAERRICGFLDDRHRLGNGVIGRVDDLSRIARQHFVDEIILAAPQNPELTRRVIQQAQRLHLDVEIVPELFGCEAAEEEIERLGDVPVICVHAERLPFFALFLKRVLDVVVASAALLALVPALAIIAVLIKVDSAGPIFYCAPRAGRKGRLFPCLKFRTMVSNADELKGQLRHGNKRSGPFFKLWADPRVTRVGRILRRYSLDEVPQLWNVLRGEMSLVGPRPHPVDDVAKYEVEHLARLDVTPGITGLWQVTARRDPSFDRGMELDREYIQRWSLGLDARILLHTLRAVVEGSGD